MRLSEHFTLEEMERSGTALSLGIQNHAPTEAISNLRNLCHEVLEPLRRWLNETYPLPGRERPIIVSSGYRCRALNSAVGGASNSQHMTGEAVDIAPLPSPKKGGSCLHPTHTGSSPSGEAGVGLLFSYIRDHLPYDQLILEHDRHGNRWIHVSLRRDATRNRHQCIANLEKR